MNGIKHISVKILEERAVFAIFVEIKLKKLIN